MAEAKKAEIVWRGGYQKSLLEAAVTALCSFLAVIAVLFALEQAFYPPVIYPADEYQSCGPPLLFERSHITQSMTDGTVPSLPSVVDRCERIDQTHDVRAGGAAVIAVASLVSRRRVESRARKRAKPRIRPLLGLHRHRPSIASRNPPRGPASTCDSRRLRRMSRPAGEPAR